MVSYPSDDILTGGFQRATKSLEKNYGNWFNSRTRVRFKSTTVSGAQQPYEFLKVEFYSRQ